MCLLSAIGTVMQVTKRWGLESSMKIFPISQRLPTPFKLSSILQKLWVIHAPDMCVCFNNNMSNYPAEDAVIFEIPCFPSEFLIFWFRDQDGLLTAN